MVIRNYHWLNSASRVLISTTPLVQTGERKQFSLFDLDLWPTTLTYNSRLAKFKVDPRAKNQGQRSNGSNRRAPKDKQTDDDATKCFIARATRSIKIHLHFAVNNVAKTVQTSVPMVYDVYSGSKSIRQNHPLIERERICDRPDCDLSAPRSTALTSTASSAALHISSRDIARRRRRRQQLATSWEIVLGRRATSWILDTRYSWLRSSAYTACSDYFCSTESHICYTVFLGLLYHETATLYYKDCVYYTQYYGNGIKV